MINTKTASNRSGSGDMKQSKLSAAMIRELQSIEMDGNPSDPCEWEHAPKNLWFVTRDRVLSALIRRGLIVADEGFVITDAGRSALARVHECS